MKSLTEKYNRNRRLNWQKHGLYGAKEVENTEELTRGKMSDLKQKYKLGKLLG